MTEDSTSQLPEVLETCVGMLPSTWREKTHAMMLRFVGKRLAPELYRSVTEEADLARGKAIVSDGLARAALEKIVSDPQQVERAVERFYGDQVLKQQNLESIVAQAGSLIEERVGGEIEPPPSDIDDDWRRKFTSFAEDVSSPEMQTIWAQILAGEFRDPGTYSFRTLRLVSELPPNVARTFQDLSKWVANGDAIACVGGDWNEGELFSKAKLLGDWGISLDAPGESSRLARKLDDDQYAFPNGKVVGLLHIPDGPEKIGFPIMLLTQSGVELLGLLPPANDQFVMRKILEAVRKDHPKAIFGQIFSRSTNGLIEVVFDTSL
ncbi:DUF2806 domain-containing protein [Altererythrobacter sp. MF3-039]|uniref:DUF2806 domain-containing protein n=1 Tax=Altererythrobacter sp. MF3-039 TaxID=3252901 RepID=UPI00390C4A15